MDELSAAAAMTPDERFDRTVYAAVAATIGGGLVFIYGAAATSKSPDFDIRVVLGGTFGGALVAAALGWFFGAKVLDWLSEAGPPWSR